jgi:hypothetical protein
MSARFVLASGKRVSADFVVAGIGVVPIVELFSPDPAERQRTELRVNKFLETTAPEYGPLVMFANYPDRDFSVVACGWSTGITPWSKGGLPCAT